MISSVSYNPTPKTTSFKGIVKVGQVFIDGVKTTDFKAVDSAVKQLKAVLMRQADTKETFAVKDAFRSMYWRFDKDYNPPDCKLKGDTRHIMSKVRAKGSSQTFIVTGKDAQSFANSGVDIGRKRALERVSEGYKNRNAGEIALDSYRTEKDIIEDNFYSRKDLLHPQVTIYTEKDKKGILRLTAAKLENDFKTGTICKLNPPEVKKPVSKVAAKTPAIQKKTVQQNPVKTVSPKEIFIPKTTEVPHSVSKPEVLLKFLDKKQEENPLLKELSTKNWDSFEKAQLKKKRRKKGYVDPNQMDFFKDIKA